jgi:glutamate racemase
MRPQRESVPKNVLIFDSGIGGVSVLRALHALMPEQYYSYCADNAMLPYGDKPDNVLKARIVPLFEELLQQSRADIAIIACNTASTLLLDTLRTHFDVPFIGVVPAIKPAAAISKSGHIALLATPATIHRSYIDELQQMHGGDTVLSRIACPQLVDIAERKLLDGTIDHVELKKIITNIAQVTDIEKIDSVILGCTHFPLLQEELKQYWPRPVNWLDSSPAIAKRCQQLIALMPNTDSVAQRQLFTTSTANIDAMMQLLLPFGISSQRQIEISA